MCLMLLMKIMLSSIVRVILVCCGVKLKVFCSEWVMV